MKTYDLAELDILAVQHGYTKRKICKLPTVMDKLNRHELDIVAMRTAILFEAELDIDTLICIFPGPKDEDTLISIWCRSPFEMMLVDEWVAKLHQALRDTKSLDFGLPAGLGSLHPDETTR